MALTRAGWGEGKEREVGRQRRKALLLSAPGSRRLLMDHWAPSHLRIPLPGSRHIQSPSAKYTTCLFLCCHPLLFFFLSPFKCLLPTLSGESALGKRNQKHVLSCHLLEDKRKALDYQPLELLRIKVNKTMPK